MSSYLNSTTIAAFTGAFGRHFDTFTRDRSRLVTIYKEPQKIVVSAPTNPIYGYGQPSAPASVTYIDVTGVYPAIIMYNLDQKQSEIEDVKNTLNKGEVKIKVEGNARAFMEDGRKNIRIDFDGKSFNAITSDGVQNFLGLVYYVYKLENTL